MSITKLVTFEAKDDTIEQLKALLKTMVEPSRCEDGCEFYTIYQKSDMKTFIVVESWRDEEALSGHQHTAHYKYYKEHFEPFVASKDKFDLSEI